jgi:hypothetical protein
LSLLLILVLGSAALGSAGCGVAQYAELRADGIHYLRYGYRVNFDHALSRNVLRGWLLDNFHAGDSGQMVLSQGKSYYGTALIDRDGDGKFEKEQVYFFDLKLNHRESRAATPSIRQSVPDIR